ncbi:HAD family hydrolase [Haloferacaceae archaeon DSL9]
MNGSNYDAVVYDLDGTLVHLQVDWDDVATDVVEVFIAAGIDVARSGDLWELLQQSPEYDLREEVEATIGDHEREGARTSTRLGLVDTVPTHEMPVGVCSLNCADACHIALETHGIECDIQAVVGRDSVATQKPDPEPLLTTIERLDANPENALFVGDTRRDEETAERAGVDFEYVDY